MKKLAIVAFAIGLVLACSSSRREGVEDFDPQVQTVDVFGQWGVEDRGGVLRLVVAADTPSASSNAAYLQWLSLKKGPFTWWPDEVVESLHIIEIPESVRIVDVKLPHFVHDEGQFEIHGVGPDGAVFVYCGTSHELGTYRIEPSACPLPREGAPEAS